MGSCLPSHLTGQQHGELMKGQKGQECFLHPDLPMPPRGSPLTSCWRGVSLLGGTPCPGLPGKQHWHRRRSKVRASQCGITAPGGHPNPAVPCLILRKLFNVSSSPAAGVGAATAPVVLGEAEPPPPHYRLAGEGTGGR